MTLNEGAKSHFFCSVAELMRIGDKSKLTRSDICDVFFSSLISVLLRVILYGGQYLLV